MISTLRKLGLRHGIRQYVRCLPLLVIHLALAFRADAVVADWPTLHKDSQRSGYTSETLTGPFDRKWYRCFGEELVNPYSEPIVADGKVFIGTYHGNFHAMRIEDGRDAWPPIDVGGGIGNSPVVSGDKVYFGVDYAHDEGHLYAVDVKTGRVVWKAKTLAGIWNSPASDGKQIYVGDRGGYFYAFDAQTGEGVWRIETGYMILTPASISTDGKRIVFASEDMHVYCVSPAGELLWKSAKVDGLTMRHYAPTIWGDKVVVRTNPSSGFHHALESGSLKRQHLASLAQSMSVEDWRAFEAADRQAVEIRKEIWRKTGPERKADEQKIAELNNEKNRLLERYGEKIWWDNWGQFRMRHTAARYELEMEFVRQRLRQDPGQRTFFVFDLVDGTCPWAEQPPVLYQSGKSSAGGPPCFNPTTGDLYVWGSGTPTNMSGGVPGNSGALLKIDAETGMPRFINHTAEDGGDPGGFGGKPFSQPADETQNLSLMGDTLINTHMGVIACMDLPTRRVDGLYVMRDTYGGLFGPKFEEGFQKGAIPVHWSGRYAVMMNYWHGPGCGIVAISDGRMFWNDGSHVVCLAGPDVPATERSKEYDHTKHLRREKPLWPAGNYAFSPVDGFDESVAEPSVSPAELADLVNMPSNTERRHAADEDARALRKLLDEHVTEMIDGGVWRPLYYQLGFVGSEIQFLRTSETMRVLSEALPHLPPATRERTIAYLDARWKSGWPVTRWHADLHAGKPREIHTASEHEVHRFQRDTKARFDITDLYGVWAYAHYADRWDAVLAEKEAITRAFSDSHSRGLAFKPQGNNGGKTDDRYQQGEDTLNAWLSGALAYTRIMEKAGDRVEAAKGKVATAEYLADRVWLEKADRTFVVGLRHWAKLARYRNTTWDTTRLLAEATDGKLAENVRTLTCQAPSWHHAWGDLLVGGENFTHSPQLARGLFLALADGNIADNKELTRFLDVPTCRADLYWIEKLSAMLRRVDR